MMIPMKSRILKTKFQSMMIEVNVEPNSMRMNSPIKYNGKTILEVIPENPNNNLLDVDSNNGNLHKEVIEPLMLEKKKLQDRIFSHLKDYEKRVTPFRDVFEKVSLNGTGMIIVFARSFLTIVLQFIT